MGDATPGDRLILRKIIRAELTGPSDDVAPFDTVLSAPVVESAVALA